MFILISANVSIEEPRTTLRWPICQKFAKRYRGRILADRPVAGGAGCGVPCKARATGPNINTTQLVRKTVGPTALHAR